MFFLRLWKRVMPTRSRSLSIVAAEACEAGEIYYGTVTADAVLAYLENVATAGLIRLR